MTWRGDVVRSTGAIDFFISYSPTDERWATWIAWELELAGYRTMLQAWDFVAGTNFIDFMDRGIRESTAVIAVLSRSYIRSRYGRLEWQAALRSSPERPESRLITVRVEDFQIEGLLATITFVDLVGVADPVEARQRLLQRIGEAMNGRAKPQAQPAFPPSRTARPTPVPGERPPAVTRHAARLHNRPHANYPPARPGTYGPGTEVTFLHLAGVRFSRTGAAMAGRHHRKELLHELEVALDHLRRERESPVHGLLVGGDLTASGGIREFDEALSFLVGLRRILGIPLDHVAIVPGSSDVTKAACRAYFANCEADEVEPEVPYWPKWRHYQRFFADFYDGLDGPAFSPQQPWTLFEMTDLQVVVAGLNSTIAESHLDEDHYGWIGRSQALWFARHLRGYADGGWSRLGLVRHPPAASGRDMDVLRDADTFDELVAPLLDVVPSPPADCQARLLTLRTNPQAGEERVRERDLPIGLRQRLPRASTTDAPGPG
ncbi:MAG TPA: TIR domain-containing protein [Micromonosporaceae bacterium]|nr:TIR domain-containing protein [Micromonosporaceae bacterium]